MSPLGILLFVFVGWLICSIGCKLVCTAGRFAPVTLLLVAVLAGASLFGHGCDRRHARIKRVVAAARASSVAKKPAVEAESDDEALELQMPKRAGELPVAVELTQNEPQPQPPATTPPAAAAPAVAATPTVVAPPPVAIAPPAVSMPPAPIVAAKVQVERPTWVDAPARLVNSTYSLSVKSGLYASLPECQRALDVEMKREADHYINEYLGDPGAAQRVDIPIDYLKTNVKKGEYSELVKSESVGPMHQIHALLEFDEHARADFHQRQHDSLVDERLWYAGAGAGMVLAVLGTLYGFLKLDPRSGRTRAGRLQLAATLTALVVAAGVLLLRWAVP